MDSDFIKLSPRLYIILELIALSPIFIFSIFFGIFNSIVWSMILFQAITLTLGPCYFMDFLLPQMDSFSATSMSYTAFFARKFRDIKGQIFKSVVISLFLISFIAFLYIFLFHLVPELFLQLKIPFKNTLMNYFVRQQVSEEHRQGQTTMRKAKRAQPLRAGPVVVVEDHATLTGGETLRRIR